MTGRDVFAAWLQDYSPRGHETTVARTIPTATGFVTELLGRFVEHGTLIRP